MLGRFDPPAMSFEDRPGENEYTRDEFTSMLAEGDVALMTRMRWQDRGPEELLRQRHIRDTNPHLFAVDVSQLPTTWRGQPLRPNCMKYAKRVGKKEKKKAEKKRRKHGKDKAVLYLTSDTRHCTRAMTTTSMETTTLVGIVEIGVDRCR